VVIFALATFIQPVEATGGTVVSTITNNLITPLLTVVTLNINGIRNEMLNLLTWLTETNVDVAAIQETHLRQSSRKIEDYVGRARAHGYLMWTLEKEGRGQAILIRQGLSFCFNCHNDVVNQIQRVIIKGPTEQQLHIFHVYGASIPSIRREQKATLQTLLNETSAQCLVMVLGDFNMTTEPHLDRWSASRMKIPAGETMFNDAGWLDVFRKANPGVREYTHSWCRNNRNGISIGASRIDQIWIRQSDEWTIQTCEIIPGIPSDHEAVRAKFKLKGDIVSSLRMNNGFAIPSRKIFKERIPKEIQLELETRMAATEGQGVEEIIKTLQQVIVSSQGGRPLGSAVEFRSHSIGQFPETIVQWRRAVTLRNKLVKVIKGWWQPSVQQAQEMVDEIHRVEGWTGTTIQRSCNPWAEITAMNRTTKILLEKHHRRRDEWNNQQILRTVNERDKVLEEGSHSLYNSVRSSPRFHPATVIVRGKDDGKPKLSQNQEEYQLGVLQYFQNLYANTSCSLDEEVEEMEMDGSNQPPITLEELEEARRKLRNGKRPGLSEIQVEVIKALPRAGLRACVEAFQKIASKPTTFFPPTWREEIVSLIYKKGQPNMLSNYRGIVLLDTFYKWFVIAIKERIIRFIAKITMPFQAGGLPQRRVEENVWLGRAAMEDAQANGSPLVMAFIDLEKAFDRVPTFALLRALKVYNIPIYLIRIVKAIYRVRNMRICTKYGLTNSFQTSSGIKQGCPLSPLLFALFMNMLIDEISSVFKNKGILIRDKVEVLMLAFMDDLTLLSSSLKEMQALLNELACRLETYGMKINQGKSGWYTLNINNPGAFLSAHGTSIPRVDATNAYKWLGLWTTGTTDDAEGWIVVRNKWRETRNRIVSMRCPKQWKIKLINEMANPSALNMVKLAGIEVGYSMGRMGLETASRSRRLHLGGHHLWIGRGRGCHPH
jgi:exonuclease III